MVLNLFITYICNATKNEITMKHTSHLSLKLHHTDNKMRKTMALKVKHKLIIVIAQLKLA